MAITGINVLNIVKLEPCLLDLHVLACVLPLFSSSIVFRSQMYVSILTLLFFVEIYKKTIFWVIRSLRWPHLIDDIPLCVTHDTTEWSVVSVSVCEDDSERSSEEWEGGESAFHTYVKWICILINALQLSWYAKQHVLMAAICRGAQAKQRIGYSFISVCHVCAQVMRLFQFRDVNLLLLCGWCDDVIHYNIIFAFMCTNYTNIHPWKEKTWLICLDVPATLGAGLLTALF